ncbi:MAG: stage II sporulation protein M [Bacillota bacterium]
MGRTRRGIGDHLRVNAALYIFVTIVLAMGVVFGALAVRTLDEYQQEQLIDYFQLFLRGLSTGVDEIEPAVVLRAALMNHLRTVGLVWLLGLTVIGVAGVVLVIVVRGFVIGFTVGFLAQGLGLKGVLFAIAAVLPQNLLAIPAFLVISAASLGFSWLLVKSRLRRQRFRWLQEFAGYSLLVMAASLVLALAAVIEAYIAPVFMQMVNGLMQ